MANLILNIPHSSSYVPKEDIMKVFLPHISSSFMYDWTIHPEKKEAAEKRREAIEKELLVMTDWYTDELFDQGLGKAIIAPVSRLVCDIERFSHDENESMAQRGMGFCYKNGSREQAIKDYDRDYQDEILWRYYAPHHIALTDVVSDSLSEFGKALILDCHSFSPDPLPYEPEQDKERPDICIGTDDYHTAPELAEFVMRYFKSRGFSVDFNKPYAGTIVPLKYYRKDKRVKSIMVEVNRGLYLKAGTKEKSEGFSEIRKVLFDLEVLLKAQ